MRIVEIFKSIQGEGINMGRQAIFIRTSGCNINPPCVYCDTAYAFTGGTEMTHGEITSVVYGLDNNPNMVVFTGGEPMLHSQELLSLVRCHFRMETRIALETNGKLPPDRFAKNWVHHIAISPKLNTACETGYDIATLVRWAVLLCPKEFKFVITCPKDLEEVDKILSAISHKIPVVFQPNGQTDDYPLALRELYEWVSDSPLQHRVRILPQLHRIMWGGKRGV